MYHREKVWFGVCILQLYDADGFKFDFHGYRPFQKKALSSKILNKFCFQENKRDDWRSCNPNKSSSTLIEKFAFHPDFLNLGFLEKIVNMPEGFFLLTQVAFYSTLKTTSGSSYIKIDSLAEFFCA